MLNLGFNKKNNFVFTLPNNIFSSRIAILGMTGTGKSYTASIIMEEFLENHMPVIIIDPQGHHYGLREKYPIYIFGGDNADFNIRSYHGKIIAKVITEFNVSVIIDLSKFYKSWREEFIRDFFEELMIRNRRVPRYVLIDAADQFIPQNMNKVGIQAFLRTDALVREGRGNGISVMVISQRTQLISKDSISQCDIFIFLKMVWPNDIRTVDYILSFKGMNPNEIKIIKSTLINLNKGEGIVYAPSLLNSFKIVKFRKKYTTHTGFTPEFGKESPKIKFLDLTEQKRELMARIQEMVFEDEEKKNKKKAR